MGGSIGGGNTRGDVKNKKTYIGDNAGRQAGILDQLLGIYGGGQQQANAQNDLLFGGQKYGNAGQFFGQPGGGAGSAVLSQPAPGGGGAPIEAGRQSYAKPAEGGGDPDVLPPPGGGGWLGGNGQGGNNTPFFDPNRSGQATPAGGLVGTYQGYQNNPWQQGPNGDNETDALGSYDWMASGQRTDPEGQVYGGYGNLGKIFGPGGTQNGQGGTVEGDIAGFQGGQMQGGMTGDEAGVYGDTARYGGTRGADVGTASDTYRGMVGHGGYDDATKAAMTRESLAATRNPFEQARNRVLRGAAARGNVGSTQGTEIQLANQEAGALGDTAARNQIAQAQEAIRQKEAGASGLVGTQGVQNAATQFALGQRAAQNQQQRGYQQAGAQGLSSLAQQAQGARQAGLAGQAGQNQALRTQQLQGTQGKEGMFNTMFGRGQAGTAGLQGLYNTGQQQRAGDLAGIGNVGGKTAEDYVESGSQTGSI